MLTQLTNTSNYGVKVMVNAFQNVPSYCKNPGENTDHYVYTHVHVYVTVRERERELTRRLVKVLSLITSEAMDVLLHWSTAEIRRTTCNLVLPRGGSSRPTVVSITPIWKRW